MLEFVSYYYFAVLESSCGPDTSRWSAEHTRSYNCATGTPASGTFGTVTYGNLSNTNPEEGATFVARAEVGTQIWSDVVLVSNCVKDVYDNAKDGGYRTDCRDARGSGSNNFHGHYFSWCFVKRYAEALCPAPWKVPTQGDFRTLHQILTNVAPPTAGGTASVTTGGIYTHTIRGQTGGTWQSRRFTGYAAGQTTAASYYWSSSEQGGTGARTLYFGSTGVRPDGGYDKSSGYALRCVRDFDPTTDCERVTPIVTDFIGSDTYCATDVGTEITITPVFENAGSKPTFVWTFTNGTNVVGDVNANGELTIPLPSANTTYVLTITNTETGCVADPSKAANRRTITVDALQTITRGGGAASQTVDAGTAITPITFSYAPGASGGTIAWSGSSASTPAGLTALSTGILGTPTTAGTYNYTVTATPVSGNTCPAATLSGTITVNAATTASGCLSTRYGSTLTAAAFGTPYFKTDREWIIPAANDKSTQIWSDVVLAPGCDKTGFAGGSTPSFNIDCRRNETASPSGARPTSQQTGNNAYYGDLFSWCAVMMHAEKLCPAPWRVPTAQEFSDLDVLLGGTGSTHTLTAVEGRYRDQATMTTATTSGQAWGGAYGGYIGGILIQQGLTGYYWSMNESTFNNAWRLVFITTGNVHPGTDASDKYFGLTLRCIRDVPPPPPLKDCSAFTGATGCNSEDLTFTLGTPYFASTHMWSIPAAHGAPAQVWSDVVLAPGCNKDSYTNTRVTADCRRSHTTGDRTQGDNSSGRGDFISWCMVHRFEDQLCPYPWRVPTCQDFINLDKAMGGNGLGRSGTVNGHIMATQTGWYTHTSGGGGGNDQIVRGGTWGGARFTSLASVLESTGSYYWSSTQHSAEGAFHLTYNTTVVNPQNNADRINGFAVRCVKSCDGPTFNAGIIPSAGQRIVVPNSNITFNTIGSNRSASGGHNTIEYRWLRNGVIIPSATAETYQPTDTGTYIRQAKDGSGCNPWTTSAGSWEVLYMLSGGCSIADPEWGSTLGTITWGGSTDPNTGITTVIGTGSAAGLAQQWTGHVKTTTCSSRILEFRSGVGGTATRSEGKFIADCRSSHVAEADLFSWCAVMRFKDQLCPDGWRVPTTADFCALDRIMNSDSDCNVQRSTSTSDGFRGQWAGAAYTGYADPAGGWWPQLELFTRSFYWSQSPHADVTEAYHLSYGSQFTGSRENSRGNKSSGMALRCVRDLDLEIDMTHAGCNQGGLGASTGSIPGIGTVTYGGNANITATQRTVSRGANSQTWSAHVQAGICTGRGNPDGGSSGSYNADCRVSTNTISVAGSTVTGGTGIASMGAAANGRTLNVHLFTWCFVMRFRDELCPTGWRVPTTADFALLHLILTGSNAPAQGISESLAIANSPYADQRAQATSWAGAAYTGLGTNPDAFNSSYWSQSVVSASNARMLSYSPTNVTPQHSNNKLGASALRCIKE
jgi:uncharacterized protein (TIGR02145 family)